MRTNLEFRSRELSDETLVGGSKVALLLASELPKHGFTVADIVEEDWGWAVKIAASDFPVMVGCGRYEEWKDGHLCSISPARPYIRRWLRRLPTRDTIDPLATALERIIRGTSDAYDVRWWTEEENARG